MAHDFEQLQAALNEAVAYHQTGRVDVAEDRYRAILKVAPDLPVVHNNLALALVAQKQLDEAVTHFKRAIKLDANYLDAYSNLGDAYRHAGKFADAVKSLKRAQKINPEFVQALGNLGNVYLDMGQPDDAVAAYSRGLELMPDQPDLTYNLGRAFYDQGRLDDAEAAFRKVLAVHNAHPLAHWNLSHVMLLQGRFREAWVEYEWRWHCPGFTTPLPKFEQPRWDGKDLGGRTILVYAEQGFGDTIQFCRYLPKLAATAGRVVMLCQPEVARLMESVEGVDHVVSNWNHLPPFDTHIPVMSLPLLMNSYTEADFPSAVPYLTAPAEGAEPVDHEGFKVGLVWAGRETHMGEAQRSLDPALLKPLTETPGCTFYALQEGARGKELKKAGLTKTVTDLGAQLADFGDTARIIDSLDLVIGVDTAVVHLAGALNKPVWTLLPTVCDWRWMREREDSPWYPSMRLFRQETRGDWKGVVRRVADALKEAAG
ncbi:MAG: tetratricopeptide repeat protein [Rhodospirillaceae bacterium]